MFNARLSCSLLAFLFASFSAWGARVAPPAPINPVPATRQLAWHEREQYAFTHFGINTFTGREWGDGKESPAMFNPSQLDARQWVRAAKAGGFKMVVLTAKHHDGFCLWPSAYTEHSVKNSPWKGGKGDLVKEVSDACREFGLDFGVYLSPWDRHEPCYGDSPKYNEHYKKQLTELLSNYGKISMVWFDGACGEGPNGKKQVYDWEGYYEIVRRLQPSATIFSDAGPDVRWVGNEDGLAKDTNWAMYDRQKAKVGGGVSSQMGSGDIEGPDWVPAECDVSIRPGWFYHAEEDGKVKSLKHLLDIYYRSVGLNSSLHLNLPPDRRGLIHENDVARLREWRQAIDTTFAHNLAARGDVKASNTRGNERLFSPRRILDNKRATYWAAEDGVTNASIEIDFHREQTFDRAMLQEYIELGQRIAEFNLEAWQNGQWKPVVQGTTVGYKRLLRFEPVTTSKVRLNITKARACPTLSSFGLYKASLEPK